ncbi:MAG: UDP-N-acetylmuramoyl-L-alanyl-D-glutamate--2,6-diaminopimelate ligase [Chlamydiales bacterium]
MKLKKLLKEAGLELRGGSDVEITGICSDSKRVAPGNLFIAKKGLTHDGARFIPEAINAGASAVVSSIYDPFLPEEVVQIIHSDIPQLESELAKIYYQNPVDKLFLVGITGTNGKTTTSYLVRHLFESSEIRCGLIGTVEWIAGKNHHPSLYTAPDLLTNYRLFQEMVQSGCKAAVMEVSSHALEQGRVQNIEFDVAVFTNLTQDHLDYHKTMENYAEAKAKLFDALGRGVIKKSFAKIALVNADSNWTPNLVKNYQGKLLTYAIEQNADIRAHEIYLSPQKMQFVVTYQNEQATFSLPLIGRFNVYNCLAAIGVGLTYGFSLKKMADLLRSFKNVRGRLERVENRRSLNIFVDYAHTDDALKNVLETLCEIKKGKLILIFGCGGNRDKDKRPKMGSVAEQFADVCIVTSDNPRNEDPAEIAHEILKGFSRPEEVIVLLDRKEAIEHGVSLTGSNDILLIAGKGHETKQIFAHQTVHFDDCEVARGIDNN